MTEHPNPGSDEAREKGCNCPVLDNNHGRYPPHPEGFWVREGCPLHGGLFLKLTKE